jgi:hypothetical protein
MSSPNVNATANPEHRRLFDLSSEEETGLNESERILGRLCRRSFLRLWVQSNVFSDEGLRDGKGHGVELCDALLVFGDDVVIFSDKEVAFQEGKELKVAWGRWYRRAVQDSVRQLHGAKHWVQRFPAKAFLDARCTRPLPAPVPNHESVRFHLVAVTRGCRDAALAFAEGKGRGSLGLDSQIAGNQHLDHPFVLGQPEPRKQFVHVFDEVSIDLVLTELDTAADFIEYLRKREALLGRPDTQVMSGGEEDLLATYLTTMADDESEHTFVQGAKGGELPDTLLVMPGIYELLERSAPYLRRKAADRVSYVWDDLIDRILRHGAHGLAPGIPEHTPSELERGIRFLASESRFRRRQLGASIEAMTEKIRPGDSITRLFNSGVEEENVYILSIQAKRQDESLAQYRTFRQQKLFAQVRTAKLLATTGKKFVGIAFDSPYKDYAGFSEDVVALEQDVWSKEELAELRRMRRDLNLWAGHRMDYSRFDQFEFPTAEQQHPFSPVRAPAGSGRAGAPPSLRQPATAKDASGKRRRKMQKASQRKNRR